MKIGAAITVLLATTLQVLGVIACGGAETSTRATDATPVADGLSRLPDVPALRRHVLIGDLGRLRAAYDDEGDYDQAVAAIWLPDALAGARQALWQEAFGIDLEAVASFAAAGFHPAALTVARGAFARAALRATLERNGYALRGDLSVRGADGEIDPATPEGRLALAALNRIVVSRDRLQAAPTTPRPGNLCDRARRPPCSATERRADGHSSTPFRRARRGRSRRPRTREPRAQDRARVRGAGAGRGRCGVHRPRAREDPSPRAAGHALLRPLARVEGVGVGKRRPDHGLVPPSTPTLVWRELVERGDLGPLVRPAPRP